MEQGTYYYYSETRERCLGSRFIQANCPAELDSKLFTKIMAYRLQSIITDYIDPAQSGFIPGRYLTDNIHRILNIIACATNIQVLLLSIDIMKAFDLVEWLYLHIILSQVEFGNNFISAIKSVYMSPMAKVYANRSTSDTIYLHQATRQCCPIAPPFHLGH